MTKIHEPVYDGYYKVRGNTRVIMIAEDIDDEIQWACSTSISMDYGYPEILKEVMTRPNGHL